MALDAIEYSFELDYLVFRQIKEIFIPALLVFVKEVTLQNTFRLTSTNSGCNCADIIFDMISFWIPQFWNTNADRFCSLFKRMKMDDVSVTLAILLKMKISSMPGAPLLILEVISFENLTVYCILILKTTGKLNSAISTIALNVFLCLVSISSFFF